MASSSTKVEAGPYWGATEKDYCITCFTSTRVSIVLIRNLIFYWGHQGLTSAIKFVILATIPDGNYC